MTEILFDLLRARGIAYQRCDHPEVFTTAQAEQLVPPLPGAKAKNLFLRDNHSTRRFLLVVPYAKRVDLAQLAAQLSIRKLSFASADELQAVLGVTPGAVSVLALVNDPDHRAKLLVDAETWAAEAIQCHPLVNTATVVMSHDDLQRFLEATGHTPFVLDVPARPDPA